MFRTFIHPGCRTTTPLVIHVRPVRSRGGDNISDIVGRGLLVVPDEEDVLVVAQTSPDPLPSVMLMMEESTDRECRTR